MLHVLKILLLALTVVALPIQGVAAVARMHCAPASGHGHGVGDAAARVSEDHGHSDSMAQVPGGPHASAHEGVHFVAPGGAGPDDPSSSSSHKCSACAACCIGAALPAASVEIAVPETADDRLAAAEGEQLSFIADALERPPRALRG